ncbi:uncharacterized protein LOC131683107 [Topomyia yanbarensis]|uniref:uncharacterized protein LOC131683107 n=1 Tax=Topomyia yanbarensis TaxID=2498891 RepID=UPI00273B5035|nr:uncharacterized protein LOC131683107 [Topomyia yanbarensis]
MSNPGELENANQAAAASVAVKLPDFWKNDPVMWFAQAEAQFAFANVVRDHTKFYHIIAKIDHSVICHVTDLVSNPPNENEYDAVKNRLIARFQVSAQGRLERLLGSCDLGDMRPTHLLAKMQEMAAGLNVTDDLLKMLFLQRMPPNVKAILSISDGTIGKLAEMADKMLESPTSHTAATSSDPDVNNVNEYNDIRNQIAVLTAEIRHMRASRRDSQRTRSASRSSREEEICWYHRKYGGRALKCRESCKYNHSKN